MKKRFKNQVAKDKAFKYVRRTPLYYACKEGHFEIVRLLILAGAKSATPDTNGWTPLFIAC